MTDPVNRSAAILESSRRIFREHGALGLRISEIAKDVGISVGTFYSNFRSKEDLLMAMGHECLDERLKGFEGVLQTPGLNALEKVVLSILRNFIFTFDHPELYAIERIARSPSVWEESSEEARIATNDKYRMITAIVRAQFMSAIKGGYIRADGELSQQSTNIQIGMWTISSGSSQVAQIRNTMGEEASLVRRLPDGFLATVKAFLLGSGWTSQDPDSDIQRLADMALDLDLEIPVH
ncbi:MAG: TetR/AcrR family transcriptional regulator [bacterium]|nr:TetR/AcrR family transcriptional regulator [bacterium]